MGVYQFGELFLGCAAHNIKNRETGETLNDFLTKKQKQNPEKFNYYSYIWDRFGLRTFSLNEDGDPSPNNSLFIGQDIIKCERCDLTDEMKSMNDIEKTGAEIAKALEKGGYIASLGARLLYGGILMWARLVIGLDVVSTFVEGKDGIKNLYQLLRDADLGDFNGKTLNSGADPFKIFVSLVSGDEDEFGIKMTLGKLVSKEETGMDANREDGELIWRIPLDEFKEDYDAICMQFWKLGIMQPPGIMTLLDAYEEQDEFDFFNDEVVDYLIKWWDEFERDYDVPTPKELELVLPDVTPRTGAAPLTEERIRQITEYRFIMEKMGNGEDRDRIGEYAKKHAEEKKHREEREVQREMIENTSSTMEGPRQMKKGFLSRVFGRK